MTGSDLERVLQLLRGCSQDGFNEEKLLLLLCDVTLSVKDVSLGTVRCKSPGVTTVQHVLRLRPKSYWDRLQTPMGIRGYNCVVRTEILYDTLGKIKTHVHAALALERCCDPAAQRSSVVVLRRSWLRAAGGSGVQ